MTGIPSWARIGAKVVCVDAAWSSIPPANPLRLRATYTITDVVSEFNEFHPNGRLLLDEVDNPIKSGWGFAVQRFRPVHTLRQDVRAIKSALREMPVTERLDRLMELLDEAPK